MHSRAFALFIDQPAGSGPGQSGHRVVPLPSPSANVRLSFAFDDFGAASPVANAVAHIRLIDTTGTVTRTLSPFNVPRGRSASIDINPGEVAASVSTDPIGTPSSLPAVTALVEFDSTEH